MTKLLKSQRYDRQPDLSHGAVLPVVDYDGPVQVTVSWAEPRLTDGRWVHGEVEGRPVTVFVLA